MFTKFALRDAAFIAVAGFVWWLAADSSAGTGMWADFTGVVAGALLGLGGSLLHEWGHLLAALASGSVVRANENLASAFSFSFDPRRNSLSQFVIMSLGGLGVTALLVVLAYVCLPDGLLASRVARGIVLFLAFLGVTLEVPLFIAALVKGGVPAAAAVKVQTGSARNASHLG